MKPPYISVVLPVFNAEKYLKESIESILNQTFTDFEFIIFNDGSTDHSSQIIKDYNDIRIIFTDYPCNRGLIQPLNIAMKEAKGRYIARMDADDIAMPDRLQKQISFLDSHPDISVCGGAVEYFGEKTRVMRFPENHESIKLQLLKTNCIANPTAVFRKDDLDKHEIIYDYPVVEDYRFWCKTALSLKFYNLPDILLKYRIHNSNITDQIHHKYADNIDIQIKQTYIKDTLNLDLEAEMIRLIFSNDFFHLSDSKKLIATLFEIIDRNKSIRFFNNNALQKILINRLNILRKRNLISIDLITLMKLFSILNCKRSFQLISNS
jgi:glycosyltransferase involved in cell wall biosynthesis